MATAGAHLWSTTAATNATADPAVNWAEGMAPSAVNDSARAVMASFAKWRKDMAGTLTTTGGSTAYLLTTNATYASASDMDGAIIAFIANVTCAASPTLAVDSVAAKNLVTSTGAAIGAGQIIAGGVYLGTYINSANEIRLMNAFVSLNISGLTAETAIAVADVLPFYDDSATANRKITLPNLFKGMSVLSSESTIATDDEILLYDLSETAANRMTIANLLKVVNALTEDTAPDETADFIMTYDASASAVKKVLPKNFDGMGLIQIGATQSASASSVIDFTSIDSTYDEYQIHFNSVKPATDDTALCIRLGTGGGPTYASAAYQFSGVLNGNGTEVLIGSASAIAIYMTNVGGTAGAGSAAGENVSGVISFSSPDTSDFMIVRWQLGLITAGGVCVTSSGAGCLSASAITGVRFIMFDIAPTQRNIASGEFTLFGVKK